jgi:hypothetical protein
VHLAGQDHPAAGGDQGADRRVCAGEGNCLQVAGQVVLGGLALVRLGVQGQAGGGVQLGHVGVFGYHGGHGGSAQQMGVQGAFGALGPDVDAFHAVGRPA